MNPATSIAAAALLVFLAIVAVAEIVKTGTLDPLMASVVASLGGIAIMHARNLSTARASSTQDKTPPAAPAIAGSSSPAATAVDAPPTRPDTPSGGAS